MSVHHDKNNSILRDRKKKLFSSSVPVVLKLPKASQWGLSSLELLNIFLWDTVAPPCPAQKLWQCFVAGFPVRGSLGPLWVVGPST